MGIGHASLHGDISDWDREGTEGWVRAGLKVSHLGSVIILAPLEGSEIDGLLYPTLLSVLFPVSLERPKEGVLEHVDIMKPNHKRDPPN